MKRALITGITGQDGAYLAKHLLAQGYRVLAALPYGRALKVENLDFLGIRDKLSYLEVDLCSTSDLRAVLETEEPHEIYCLAAQSLVWASWEMAPLTLRFNIDSITAMLEAVRDTGATGRLFVALSSEVFGCTDILPITEDTPFRPATPYAISKVANYLLARAFRERYGIYVATGFLFNHESVLRSESFVVKKIMHTAFQIAAGRATELYLGNLNIRRDFGYAPEYVQAMHLALNIAEPDDYVIATGESLSIREIVEDVFTRMDIPMSCLHSDASLIRANDVPDIFGNADRASRKLGWRAKFKGHVLIERLLQDYQNSITQSGVVIE